MRGSQCSCVGRAMTLPYKSGGRTSGRLCQTTNTHSKIVIASTFSVTRERSYLTLTFNQYKARITSSTNQLFPLGSLSTLIPIPTNSSSNQLCYQLAFFQHHYLLLLCSLFDAIPLKSLFALLFAHPSTYQYHHHGYLHCHGNSHST